MVCQKPLLLAISLTVCLHFALLCAQDHSTAGYEDIAARYADRDYHAVIREGMPLLRELGKKYADHQYLLAYAEEIALIFQAAREGLELLTGDNGRLDIEKDVRSYYESIRTLRDGLVGGLSRARIASNELKREEKSFLDFLLDSVKKVKDKEVIDAYASAQTEEAKKRATRRILFAYWTATRDDLAAFEELDELSEEMRRPNFLESFADFCSGVKRRDLAVLILEKISDDFPNSAAAIEALKRASALCAESKQIDRAIAFERRIIEQRPKSQDALEAQYQIIKLYGVEWKVYGSAIKECRRLIEMFPNTSGAGHAAYMIGQFYYQSATRSEDYDKAISAFRDYIQRYPGGTKIAEAKLLTGLSFLAQHKNDDSVKEFRLLLKEHPNHKLAPNAQYLIAYTYLTEQRYVQAREEFQKLIVKFPKSKYVQEARRFVERLSGVGR